MCGNIWHVGLMLRALGNQEGSLVHTYIFHCHHMTPDCRFFGLVAAVKVRFRAVEDRM